jgi:hypothetical protein
LARVPQAADGLLQLGAKVIPRGFWFYVLPPGSMLTVQALGTLLPPFLDMCKSHELPASLEPQLILGFCNQTLLCFALLTQISQDLSLTAPLTPVSLPFS